RCCRRKVGSAENCRGSAERGEQRPEHGLPSDSAAPDSAPSRRRRTFRYAVVASCSETRAPPALNFGRKKQAANYKRCTCTVKGRSPKRRPGQGAEAAHKAS